MKNPWVIIGVITVVLFGGAIWFSGSANEKNNEGVEILQHIKGNPDAEVKLVEYSDLQCPACAAFEPALVNVIDAYGDDLSFEYKHFPLTTIHQHALTAAVAAEAAGQQGKFFEFHDLLFTNQTEWSGSPTPNSFYLKYAEELDLDMDQFSNQMKSSILRDKVKGEFEEARGLALTGTPSFLLNGEKMEFGTYDDFLQQISIAVDPDGASSSSSETITSESKVLFGI